MFKLLVFEPWEFGTINGVGPFKVAIKKAAKDNWLIIFDNTIKHKGELTKYLLSKTEKKYAKIDLLNVPFENIILEMALIPNLSEQNFMDYDLDDFRGEFLTGELSSISR
jgi:hypothetical protein